MFKKLALAGSALLLSLGMTACSSENNETAENEVIEIYTSIFPLKDFAEKIGGDYVEVHSALPAGTDSHTFEPTTKDIVKMAESDMFIYNGIGMEGYIETLVDTLEKEDVVLVNASKNITTIDGEDYIIDEDHDHDSESDDHDHESEEDGHDDHNHSEDPHIWFDPLRAKQQAQDIAAALIKEMPEQEAYFTENLTNLEQQFDELDADYKKVIENAPNDEILVSHAAYGYWGERYGLYQIAVTGLSPSNEPSQKQLASLVEIIKEHDIKYIFFESFGTPKIAKTIKSEVGAEVLTLNHVASISVDDEAEGKDYFDLMRENLEALKIGLYE